MGWTKKILVLAIFACHATVFGREGFEARIHVDAPPGTAVTLHTDLAKAMMDYQSCLIVVRGGKRAMEIKNSLLFFNDSSRVKRTVTGPRLADYCDDYEYFEYDKNSLVLKTRKTIDRPPGDYYAIYVAPTCVETNPAWLIVDVRVSVKNNCTPTFLQNEYQFLVAKANSKGAIIGSVKAVDADHIIYNSMITYQFACDHGEDKKFFMDEKNGHIKMADDTTNFEPGVIMRLSVSACDYGSPQKCDVVPVEITSAKAYSPENVTVISVNAKHLIVCWSAVSKMPFFIPDLYTIRVRALNNGYHLERGVKPENIDPNNSRQCRVLEHQFLPVEALMKTENDSDILFEVQVDAHVLDDVASGNPVVAPLETEVLSCTGLCYNGGVPVCVRANVNGVVQSTHFFMDGLQYCSCALPFDGHMCQRKRFCKEEAFPSKYGKLKWNYTDVGKTWKNTCPYGPKVPLTRACTLDTLRDTEVWGDAENINQCRTKEGFLSSFPTGTHANNSEISADTSQKILSTLEIFEDSIDSEAIDQQFATRVVDYVSQAVDVEFANDEEKPIFSAKVRNVLLSYGDHLMVAPGQAAVIRSENTIVAVARGRPESNQSIQLDLGKEAKVSIPPCVIQQASAKVPEPRVVAVWLRDDKIFAFNDENRLYERAVLDLNVRGLNHEQPLVAPIQFLLKYPVFRNASADGHAAKKAPSCVYWQEKEQRWSDDGLKTLKFDQETNFLHCETMHLTGFSILLDFQPSAVTDLQNRLLLNMLSYIGCGFSIIALFFTILTYSLFRCLNRDRAGKILLNLSTSMLLLNMVFFMSSRKSTANYTRFACVLIGALLHYFTLTTLAWMAVEAVNMYHMLVRVFTSGERLFIVKRCIIAWGAPMALILGTLFTNDDYYFDADDSYCRLAAAHPAVRYGAYLAPACLLLLINCIVFAFVLKVLMHTNATSAIAKPTTIPGTQTKYSTLVAQVRGALSVVVLLGITWVFGIFAVGSLRLPLLYAFCVLNSLQGFIIFLVRCLFYDEARSAWAILLRTGKLKQQRGKTIFGSRLSDSTSSHHHTSIRRPIDVVVRRQSSAGTIMTTASMRQIKLRSENHQHHQLLVNIESKPIFRENVNAAETRFLCEQRWKFIDEPSTPKMNRD